MTYNSKFGRYKHTDVNHRIPERDCQHPQHRFAPTVRFAYAGKWYQKGYCKDCMKTIDHFVRDVDQSSELDCHTADASQGIV